MVNHNFVSYENAEELMSAIGSKFKNLEGAFSFRGSVDFTNLPTVLTKAMVGYVYNVTNDFVIDNRFIEYDPLMPKKYSAGTDIAIADCSTISYEEVTPEGTENPSEEGWYEVDTEHSGEYIISEDVTVNPEKTYYNKIENNSYKFDVGVGFVDVDGINNRIASVENMITGSFDEETSYETGNVVIYQNNLYKFKVNHAAGAWDATEVDITTIAELIENAEPESLTAAQITALLALIN